MQCACDGRQTAAMSLLTIRVHYGYCVWCQILFIYPTTEWGFGRLWNKFNSLWKQVYLQFHSTHHMRFSFHILVKFFFVCCRGELDIFCICFLLSLRDWIWFHTRMHTPFTLHSKTMIFSFVGLSGFLMEYCVIILCINSFFGKYNYDYHEFRNNCHRFNT